MRNDERVAEYHERAAQLRAEADAMTDPVAKKLVLEIAERYQRLAARIETKDGQPASN